MEFLKVSSKSSPASVAGAIAGMVKDGVPVNMQCVGAGGVNQADGNRPRVSDPHRVRYLLRSGLLGHPYKR